MRSVSFLCIRRFDKDYPEIKYTGFARIKSEISPVQTYNRSRVIFIENRT